MTIAQEGEEGKNGRGEEWKKLQIEDYGFIAGKEEWKRGRMEEGTPSLLACGGKGGKGGIK